MFGCKSKTRKLLIPVEKLPSFDGECGELSHVTSVFLPLDFAGLTPSSTHAVLPKGPSMGPEEAEGQMTHRSCFTKDQWLDPDSVLKARTVCQGLQMVDGAIVVLECT
jgi:hypothetical protein